MSKVRLTGKLRLGKVYPVAKRVFYDPDNFQGCEILFKADDSKPQDSLEYRWSEVTYDGKEDSWVPEIGAHWHKTHDEFMHVIRGRVQFTLDGKDIVLEPGMEPIKIPRWHVHSFKFFKGEASTFVERTDPVGEFKMEFFEDLLDTGEIDMVRAFRAFYQGDTYIALPFGIRAIDQVFTIGVGAVVTWLYPQKNKGILAESVSKLPQGYDLGAK
jgi:mannose-6-phosphate isomerase-like protein (cupin superfamily)